MKLNIGCGKDIRPGYVNIDRKPYPGINVVLDLSQGVLPFEDGSIEEIVANDVLEHLLTWENVVVECARVLRPGGSLKVHVPYRLDLNAYHVRSFDERSFEAFVAGSTDFDGPNATTLDGCPAFRRVSRTYDRKPLYPFAWHMRRYLGVPVLGRKTGMSVVLERIEPPHRVCGNCGAWSSNKCGDCTRNPRLSVFDHLSPDRWVPRRGVLR